MAYTFTSENYGNKLLTEIKKMRFDKCMSDLTLSMDSKILRVHKVILAASSPYFKEQLSTNKSSIVVLKSSYDAIYAIIQYMYSGTTRVTKEYYKEFVSAARYFMIKELSAVKMNQIGEIPEFPKPVFINEVKLIDDSIPQVDITDTNINMPSTSKTTDNKPVYYLKMPITIDEPDISENSAYNQFTNTAIQKKRGRPRKNVISKEIQDAIEKRLETEEAESSKCLEYLIELQTNDTESNNLQQAVNSISDTPNTFTFDNDDQISFQLTDDQGQTWLEDFKQLDSVNITDPKDVSEVIPPEYGNIYSGAEDPMSSTSTMIENNSIMYVNEGDIIIDMEPNIDIESDFSMEIKDFIEI